jgi:multicomponent Na+:H+ antiporter subunit D
VSLAAHLPALQVVIPLLAAPLIVLVRHAGFAWLLTVAVSATSLAAALALMGRVRAEGVISYALGSWAPPWGIEYRVDGASAFVLALLSLVALFAAVYARRSAAEEVPAEQRYLFYAMFCLCLAGLLGMAITGDGFNFFVFLEIASLATYVLIALGRDRRALMASYQYLLLGTVGATFIVIGVGLLYLMTGTLNMADLGQRLPQLGGTRPALAALAFLTVGLFLKAAVFPLHAWLPNAYAYAPSAVTALLAGTATKVSIYAILRFYYSVFGAHTVIERLPMEEMILVLAAIAMVLPSLVAVFQRDFKRMLAYSSVGQIGYIMLGVGIATHTGVTAGIVHLFNHGITKAALFIFAGAIVMRVGSTDLERLSGLARRMPLTCAGIVVGGLSLVGVPAFAGFVTKWHLVVGGLQAGLWWVAFTPVLSSLIALAYVWRFVEVAYLRQPAPGLEQVREAPAGLLVPGLALSALIVVAGLWSGPFIEAAAHGASAFLGAPK